MPAEIQVSSYRDFIPPLKNWDEPLRLFYDETNNIRRLTLTEVGLNVPDNKTFALAGIALRPGQELAGWDQLRSRLRIQDSAAEVKFKHVAAGSYEEVLNSPKISILLEWLLERDILVHYSVLDVLHWSVLDIVESLMVDERLGATVIPLHAELKSELYFWVSKDPTAFMSLLHGYAYPDLDLDRKRVPAFLAAVEGFLEERVDRERNFVTTALGQTLRSAARRNGLELPFLHDNEPGELIKDFSSHFLHLLYVFKNGAHVFDREKYVEKALQKFVVRDGERQVDYRFEDSKNEPGIQLSDLFTGLVGRHFTYLQNNSIGSLRARKALFSKTQVRNLEMFRALIDRADAFSPALLHALLPLENTFKNDTFLHGREYPIMLEEA